jgi:hypothetical protein
MRTHLRSLLLVVACGVAALGCNSTPKVSTSPGVNPPGGPGAGGSGGGGNSGGPNVMLLDGGVAPDTAAAEVGLVSYPGGITRPCANLECRQSTCLMGDCKQQPCAGGARTTVTGRVFDPAGKIPLYNVVVYVPNAALDPIPTGPSCDRCDSATSGKPITATLTNTKGEFTLDNVPVGSDVPLVIQIGKWRRQIALPEVKACADNRADDPNLMRLPRSQREGNIPKIALATGGLDRLECLLRKMGIEDSEFTPEAGTGRVNLYAGRGGGFASPATSAYAPTLNGGAPFAPAVGFWGDPNNLKKYDMVVLSCEGNWNLADKTEVARQGMVDYANLGGRVFASHWHGAWIQFGPPPWNTVASFVPPTAFMSMNQLTDLPDGFATDIETSFPKGDAMADWLVNVQASTVRGKLPLSEGKHSVFTVDPSKAQRWIHSNSIPLDFENTNPAGVQYLTFNTPVGAAADKTCGRTVFTDIHVSIGGQMGDIAGPPFPMGCVTTDLSPQEKALAFMLFDLSSCIQPDQERPKPPVID